MTNCKSLTGSLHARSITLRLRGHFAALTVTLLFIFLYISISIVPVHAQIGPAPAILSSDFAQQFLPARDNHICLCPGDQIWIVSTREMEPCCEIAGKFQVAFFNGCEYQTSSIDELTNDLAQHPELQNVVHLHGDFTDLRWAISRGEQVYLNSIAGNCCRQPVRMIIWAWKSERVAVPFRDFRVKTDWSHFEGVRFAEFMSQTNLSTGIMIGYSMGAQIALRAIDEIASTSGQSSNELSVTGKWRLILPAPALAPQFSPQYCFGTEWDSIVDEIAILSNSKDRALRFAKRSNRRTGLLPAIDQYSLPCSLPISGDRVYSVGAECEVGGKHSIVQYSKSSTFQAILSDWLLTPANSLESLAGESTESLSSGKDTLHQ
ncbi:MAG: hypothetical protein R3C03_11750 [Pirellulaceae bacterium]